MQLKNYYLVIFCALFVGFLYLAPYIGFMVSAGAAYQGIPMTQTPNEISYLARIREIIDGHEMIGSFSFFEYKNQWPLMPPTGEMFYALPSLLFGISLITTLMASKFILPFILFLLVYILSYNLLPPSRLSSRKVSALATALLVVLGYDLVDYHSLFGFLLRGEPLGGSFLLWARPVNPILGAIFLFAFLSGIWAIIQRTKYQKTAIGSAGLFLALMIMSYFFSWGIGISILGFLILVYLYRREFKIVKRLAMVVVMGVIMALPYWYMSWLSSQSPWYQASVLRSGLIYTHYPLINKFLLATLVVYLIVAWSGRWFKSFQDWQWFCLAFILGGFWALNQQIITGVTIWPYHFVQYSIPLAIIVLATVGYNSLRIRFRWFWIFIIISVVGSSLLFGVYSQIHAYRGSYAYYAQLQPYTEVFSWFNSQAKDCVVLVNNQTGYYDWDNMLLAFTHCNVYTSTETAALLPEERLYHNYLVHLRLQGVTADNVETYIKKNDSEIVRYLAANWAGSRGLPEFPDFSDQNLKEIIKNLPQDYRQFMKKDFKDELLKYRLDYILSFGPLDPNIIAQLGGLNLEFQDKVFIYSLKTK